MAKNAQGTWCCDCDYCIYGTCTGLIHATFLSDHRETHNYYLYCETHKTKAENEILSYMQEYSVTVEESSNPDLGKQMEN